MNQTATESPITRLTADQMRMLYSRGILKIESAFSSEQLNILKKLKQQCYERYPYGQDLNGTVRKAPSASGDCPIQQLCIQDPFFCELLLLPLVRNTIESILGKDYCLIAFTMRKILPGTGVLPVHRDQAGSASIALLLDDIGENEGATCFYPGTHFNYPPAEYYFHNPAQIEEGAQQATGKYGDLFFWFADVCHARVIHQGNEPKTMLLAAFENCQHSQARAYMFKGINAQQKAPLPEDFRKLIEARVPKPISGRQNKFYSWIFKWVGNSPSSLWKRYIYILLAYRFKFLHDRINTIRYPYTRIVDEFVVPQTNFSFLQYIGRVRFKRFLKMSALTILNIIPGGKKLRKKLKKN